MSKIDVSVILPVYNAEKWLNECLASVESQTFKGTCEVSVFNDGSTDGSAQLLLKWQEKLRVREIFMVIGGHHGEPKGVGFAKNRAVEQSSGQYLCFLDADDVMSPDRVEAQFEAARKRPNTLIGCQFHREPADSTERYTRWANNTNEQQLYHQAFTSHGPTLIMPTWFCSREVYYSVGGFHEGGKGTPEDLIFFYKHLELGHALYRVNRDLLMYRYHPQAETFSIKEETIWDLRMAAVQKHMLSKWPSFTIWNAGKQGRHFYRSLSPENKKKVSMFCDVSEEQLRRGCYTYQESKELPKPQIPIVHFSEAKKPFVICVKMDLTGGALEANIESLQLTEGVDFIHFN